jgi:DedD protein
MSDNPDALLIKKRARRRLIGAVALVLFVVIVLPMVLDKEPKPLQNELSVQIPRQDSGSFKTRVLPPTAVPGKADEAVVSPKTDASPVAANPVPAADPKPQLKEKEPESGSPKAATAAKPEPVPVPQPAKKAEPKAAIATLAPKTGGETQRAQAVLADESWVVPMGAFANPDNVKQLQAKLQAAGVKSVTEILKTAEGEKIRVRGGPFKTRAEAEKARESLKAAGLDAGAVTLR